MKVIISPAKKLNEKSCDIKSKSSIPFSKDSEVLIKELKNFSSDQLKSLMGVSSSIANLNKQRFNDWSYPFNGSSKPAVFMFDGAVYNELDVQSLNEQDILYMQDNLRILSGLYGILKPLDSILPYRLEMGTKLSNSKGKNLYEFWGNKVQENILKELKANKSNLIVNLASKEYFTVVGSLPKEVEVVSPVFKDFKNGEYKLISFYAKKARGYMSHWMIKNKVTKSEDLKNFDAEGYKYSKKLSTESEPVFLRN